MFITIPHPDCELWINTRQIERLYIGRRALPEKNGNGKVYHVTLQFAEGQEVIYFPTFEQAKQFADSILQSLPEEDTMFEIKEIPTVSVKRSISPDGRVNSISFFLQVPITDPANVDHERMHQLIALLNQLAENWQAEAILSITGSSAEAHAQPPTTRTPAQPTATQTPTHPTENDEDDAEEELSLVTRIRFVDKVPSKFDPNGQYRVKFASVNDNPVPAFYVSLDRMADILADFRVATPEKLKGLPVCVTLRDGRVRRIAPIRKSKND
jgi:hypothetical protein